MRAPRVGQGSGSALGVLLTPYPVPCSGLSQEVGSVEQLTLRCAEGSLEWLYPTGALRLRLAPRLPPATTSDGRDPRHVTACLQPAGTFRGAQLYLERDGELELLLPEAEVAPRPRVRCFSWPPHEQVALFLQATPQRDISRRIAAFRYELRGDWLARPALPAEGENVFGCSKWENHLKRGISLPSWCGHAAVTTVFGYCRAVPAVQRHRAPDGHLH